MGTTTRTAARVEPAFADPAQIVALVRSAGPFWPLANYASNDAEMAALKNTDRTYTPPWFRQDFVRNGEVLVDGAEAILDNPAFLDAARRLAGPDAVLRPTSVYVNIMGPTPFAFPPHLDVPAFRGVTRADYPIWLLKTMKNSGLFEAERIQILTAVSWFYEGVGGDFHYWPEGPDGAPAVISPPFDNVSVIADNESTFHGVAKLGRPDAPILENVHSGCRLLRGDGGWDINDVDGSVISAIDDADARITISWKCDRFASADEATSVDAGDGSLTLADVLDRFCDDLDRRGLPADRPVDPLNDQAFIELLAATYPEGGPTLN